MNLALETLLARIDVPGEIIRIVGEAALDDDLARRLAVWMIERAKPFPDAAAPILSTAIRFHESEMSGKEMSPELWRSLRRAAVMLGDGAAEPVRLAGAVAEAAAWPLSTARAGLADLLSALGPVVRWQAASATGWREEDGARTHEILDGLLAEGLERSAIPGRFAEMEPELSARFVAQLDAANTASLALPGEVAEALKRLAGDAAQCGMAHA